MVIIEILVALLFVVEAILEKYVILLKDPNHPDYKELDKKEHFWSALFSLLICATIAVASKEYLAVLSLLVSRRIFFDYTLKILRKRPIKSIQGGGFWDSLSRKVFGAEGGYYEALAVLSLKTALLIFIP